MPIDKTYAQSLNDEAHNINEQMRSLLERSTKDGWNEETQRDYDRMGADYDAKKAEERAVLAQLDRDRENEIAREALAPLITPTPKPQERHSAFERYIRTGDTSGLNVERDDETGRRGVSVDISRAAKFAHMTRSGMSPQEIRGIVTDVGAGSLVVPTDLERTLYAYVEAESALLGISRVIVTDGGNPVDFPRVGTHAIGTQVIGQGTAIGGTDPVFEKLTLNSFKYGDLIKVSSEALEDAGIDIVSFVAEDSGRAVGILAATAYATGNGTTQPNGIINAAGTGVKTGGTVIPLTYENLIDLEFSIAGQYRRNASWVFNDATAGSLRKIREDAGGTTGAFLWQPSVIAGQPDTLLGHPVYTDTNFASQGSASRSVAFGDFSKFYIRIAGGIRFERSDHYAFNTDEVAFRAVLRTDSDLIDGRAIKTTSQSV